jgi:NAD(P)-dependent dehydrogenase (short-subunit alcohol dehydrogenase family)
MRKQGAGRIIHIASQLGHVTFGQRALYGLTKAALIHLTKSMAYELAREKVIVNAISPGPIDTGRSLYAFGGGHEEAHGQGARRTLW